MAFVQHGNLLLARINQCLPVHDDLHNRQALVLPILRSAVDSPGYPGESGGQSDCCRLWPETLQFAQPNQRTTVTAMSINLTPRIVTDLKPKFEIKVDLDERSFLFPAGKSVSQLLFVSDGRTIFVEAVYPFNQSRTPPRLASMDLEDAREFGRRLIEAVHCARTQLVVTQGARISINVIANGYHVQFGDMNNATELFLGTNCIWRVCQGLLRIADLIAPVESN